jgi:hypothetical protein
MRLYPYESASLRVQSANGLVAQFLQTTASDRDLQSNPKCVPDSQTLCMSALMPFPRRCSTGLLAKNCGTRYNWRRLLPNPLSTIAIVAVSILTTFLLVCRLLVQPFYQSQFPAYSKLRFPGDLIVRSDTPRLAAFPCPSLFFPTLL